MVLESLRAKTGFQEMRFDESGFLTLGDRTRFAGGSASARELLIATIDGHQAIELEAHNNSPDIAFARITSGIIHISFQTEARIEARQVQLDFSDFAKLRGDREAIVAFDLGFAVLHELAHGVLHLRDAVGETTELGECDEHVNRMRRELHLPERQGYTPRVQWVVVPTSRRTARGFELIFIRASAESGRTRTERFYLSWEAEKVASDTNAVSRL
jgi:hypothetical protein